MFGKMYSQSDVQVHYTMSGGLLGAVNFSSFRTSNGVDYQTKAGWGAGGYLNFPITSGLSIEPQLMYNSYHFRTSNTTTALLVKNGKASFISIPLLLKINAGNTIGFSVGPQFDFLTGVEDNNVAISKSNFKGTSFSLSGGLEIMPHGPLTLFGRYIFGLNNFDNRPTHPSVNEYKFQNIQVGLKFRLFGKKVTTSTQRATTVVTPVPVDTDGDGITDDVDKCPTVAGLAKYNGCPIPDTDGDGINDEQDKCPTQAGLAKYNGCPIPDTDGDGINDEEDKCPTQAGPKDRMGCPVTDRDNDGIDDDHDKCPDIAGTQANNGCPDVPANVSKSVGMIGPNVSFGANTAKLNTRSNASLDKLVAIMNDNPGLKVKIEAHTSNAGDATKNQTLSENRANAVKDYLVCKGISADRITAEGFGGTQPIADNTTAAGRTKNNRVEIRMEY